MRVLDQLIAVAIAGHDDDVVATISALGGECGDDVVGFEDLFQRWDRHLNSTSRTTPICWRRMSGAASCCAYRWRHLVPEGRLGSIERDGDVIVLISSG